MIDLMIVGVSEETVSAVVAVVAAAVVFVPAAALDVAVEVVAGQDVVFADFVVRAESVKEPGLGSEYWY